MSQQLSSKFRLALLAAALAGGAGIAAAQSAGAGLGVGAGVTSSASAPTHPATAAGVNATVGDSSGASATMPSHPALGGTNVSGNAGISSSAQIQSGQGMSQSQIYFGGETTANLSGTQQRQFKRYSALR